MRYVRYLKDQMVSGLWREETGEAIKISKNGELLDGQHRLRAVSSADITLQFMVITDLEESIFDVIDQGKKRSGGDILSCAGIINFNKISTGIIKYNQLKNGYIVTSSSQSNIPSMATPGRVILETYLSDPDSFQDSHRKSDFYYRHNKSFAQSFYFAVYHFLKTMPFSKINEFLDGFCIGANLEIHDPRLILRNEMNKYISGNKSLKDSTKMAYFIKAYNAYLTNKPIKLIRFSPENESFPLFITE